MEDATAVSTALQSEDIAFESLYRLHRPPVYAYALSTLRHPADAEDVTQTTFLNAYCALHRGVAPRDDLQWLLAIARNVCRDRFRDAKRRPKEEPLADAGCPHALARLDALPAPDGDLHRGERCTRIDRRHGSSGREGARDHRRRGSRSRRDGEGGRRRPKLRTEQASAYARGGRRD